MQTIIDWLKSFPDWDGPLYMDYTEPGPGNGGLFSLGTEELERKEDVLGNVQIRLRRKWELRRKVSGRGNEADAQWMTGLEDWVRRQSLAGTAPVFGDIPRQEHLKAEHGKCTDAGVYSLVLTAEFTRMIGCE